MSSHSPRGARTRVVATTLTALLFGSVAALAAPGTAHAAPEAPPTTAPDNPLTRTAEAGGGTPLLNLKGGETVEGTTTLSASPTAEGDSVTSLQVRTTGGRIVSTLTAGAGATPTRGLSYLDFDMGGNGTDAVFGNYITVNGHGGPTDDAAQQVFFPTILGGQHGSLAFPTEWLKEGENTVTIKAMGAPAYYAKTSDRPKVPAENWTVNPHGEGVSCINKDDFTVSSLSLTSLGVVTDGETNNFSYTLSDGICGDGGTKIDTVDLTFLVQGEPGATRGLSADYDTAAQANGDYELVATTAAQHTDTAAFSINNAPAGAAVVRPTDNTVVHGTQSFSAALPAGTSGTVSSLKVDGTPLLGRETLAPGTTNLTFTVAAGNSVEAKYHNTVEVNGHSLSLGGDYGVSGDETVSLDVPNRLLVPGANTLRIVTGTYNGTLNGATCANHDDFKVYSDSLLLTPSTGTATRGEVSSSGTVKTGTVGSRATWNLGDGTCGAPATSMNDVAVVFDIADARTTRATDTLGSGQAHLRMFVGGNGMDAGYSNQIIVNGNPVDPGQWAQETADIVFPNEYLSPGINVVEIVAGHNNGAAGGTCDNYDDFLVSNVSLTAEGAQVQPLTRFRAGTNVTIGASTYPVGSEITQWFGDGSCDSSHNPTKHTELRFLLTGPDGADLPATGLRAEVDSTTLSDGRHTVAAAVSAADGDLVATRSFVVDNTAPVVDRSVPAAGQRVTSTLVLGVTLKDASGVASQRMTLDGTPIENGAEIGHGLSSGPHTLSILATDSLGNAATRTVEFTSASIPTEPSALTSAVEGSTARLEATIGGEAGAQVQATFTAADVVLPTTGYQGVADSVPTQLDVAGDHVTRLKSLQPFDSRTVDTRSAKGVVFQRYDIAVPEGDAQPVLRWEGIIDPSRTASLRVWNTTTSTWQVLTSTAGSQTGSTVLSARVAGWARDNGKVHVLVTGEDPFTDNLSPRDASAQENKDTFENPRDYEFAFTHFTDTQYLAEGAAGGTYDDWDGVQEDSDVMTADEQQIWKNAYGATTQWIADNAKDRKIVYNAHTGDVIENDYYNPDAVDADGNLVRPGVAEQVERELAVTSELHRTLDDSPVVNQVIAGNHDNQLGNETGPDSRFSRTFSAQRYYDAARNWPTGASFHTWDEKTDDVGNVTQRGKDSQNNYVLFSAGGLDFVSVGLSYGVTKQEVAWADSVLKRFKDRNAIILSHDYLKPSANADGRGSQFSAPDGAVLYNQLVEKNPNVFLVLAGHEHGVGTNVKANVKGGVSVHHNVVELLADYQFYTVTADKLWPGKADEQGNIDVNNDGTPDHKAADRLQFGASFLRMLQFNTKNNTVSVDTYSPFFDDFGATEYDIRADGSTTKPRYNGSEDNMVLPIDLSTRKTSFSTDSLALYVPGQQIGTSTVTAGEKAQVSWPGLTAATPYGWLVTATTADGGTATADPAVLRTTTAQATLSAAPGPVAYGSQAVVPVSVSTGDTVVNDGTVTVSENGVLLGSARVTGNVAQVSIPAGLQPGSHALSLEFAHSDVAQPATGSTTLVVNRGGALLRAEAPSVQVGRPARVQVRVDAAGLPTGGTVSVVENGRTLGTAQVKGDVATVSLPATLAAGKHTLSVRFSGNAQVDAGQTAVVLVVSKAPLTPAAPVASSVRVTATPATVKPRATVRLSVRVQAAKARSGVVQVRSGGTVLRTARVGADGRVTVRLKARSKRGVQTFTVRYLGNAQVKASRGTATVRVAKRR